MTATLFFIHVMKTGGATFRRHIEKNLGAEHVYPNAAVDEDLLAANLSVSHLRSVPEDRARDLLAYTGHLPFAATQILPGPFFTLTVLRNPVERTISYLKHCRTYQEQHHGLALEEIYEDPWYYPTLIENLQTKVFAIRPEDEADTVSEVIRMDEGRLATACANLATVDLLGLHERYDEFVAEASAIWGWPTTPPGSWHVSEPEAIDPAFRRRIEQDMAIDMEFVDFARNLHASRQRGRR